MIADLTLADETRVAVAGDWHSNIPWIQSAIPRLARSAPDVRTILHVGDFNIWPERGKGFLGTVDYWMNTAGITRVLLTPGNHEFWSFLDERFTEYPANPVRLSQTVWALPRAYRFMLGARLFLSFGGAASLDIADRTPFRDWWPTEAPTEEDVELAIAGGAVDVLLAHETVNGGTPAVERILRANPRGWSPDELEYSAISRARVTRVWESVQPSVLVHGHVHLKDEVSLADGRRVYSMGCDGQDGNLALLTLEDLDWEWLRSDREHQRTGRGRNG